MTKSQISPLAAITPESAAAHADAWRRARARRAAAAQIEDEALNTTVSYYVSCGLSRRQIAAKLGISKTTAARVSIRALVDEVREWFPGRWVQPDEYLAAYNDAYRDHPGHQLERAPWYQTPNGDGTVTNRIQPARGRAVVADTED